MSMEKQIPPLVANRFRDTYRDLSKDEKHALQRIKTYATGLEEVIEATVPVGREKSIAFTHLEDCVMRAVRGITE